MAEYLVENVGFLQVVQLFGRADKSGDGKALAGQQLEKRLERNQRRHPGHLPARGAPQHLVDLGQLRDAFVGQGQLLDAIQVLLARPALDQLELAADQCVPHLMFAIEVVDEPLLIRFAGHVMGLLHAVLQQVVLVMGVRRVVSGRLLSIDTSPAAIFQRSSLCDPWLVDEKS